MAAAEEEARQKALKALKEKNDMLIAIKERKQEGQLLKYYAMDKNKEHVKEKDKEGMLPIHWAAQAQCKNNVFECLLEAYPEGIKEMTKDGVYCLHLLCTGAIQGDTIKAVENKIKDKTEAVETLVTKFPDPCAIRIDGKLPIHLATKNGVPEGGIESLLKGYPDGAKEPEEGTGGDGNLPLHNATISLSEMGSGNKELRKATDATVDLLVNAYPQACSTPNAKGSLPIHYAAQKVCNAAVMASLLKAFPDGTKAKNELELIPLQIAAMYQGLPEVMAQLIQVYPDATRVKDKDGRFPARIAFENAASDGTMDALLVTYPQAAEEREVGSGKLLLHYAAEKKSSDPIVQSLLTAFEGGAKVLAMGNLPLHYASQCNASDAVVDMITKAFPDGSKQRDFAGNMPIHLAAQYQATAEAVKTLLWAYYAGAKEFVKSSGSLPLHFAAGHQSSDAVVQVLLEAYPDACRVKDLNGALPLHLAYAKQIALEVTEKLKLTERKTAELAAYKFHQEGFDASKLKVEMKAADDNAAEKVEVHKKALEEVKANAALMTTLIKHTFEVLSPQMQPNEPIFVPPNVHSVVKEKMVTEDWLVEWKATVDQMAKSKGNPAKDVDKLGNLPLHRALTKKAPLDAVVTILETYPDAVKTKDGGETSCLHLAIHAKCTEAVVLKILDAHPEGAKEHERMDEKLPLHVACEKMASDAVISGLLVANFLATRETSKHGFLPLHAAAEHPTSNFVMGLLLMAGPDAPKAKANDGSLPLHRACKRQAPFSVVQRLLEAYPDGTKQADVRGNLPLHWAVGKHAAEEVVAALIATNPEACMVADNDGNLPLHIAIEYEASDVIITTLIDQFSGATRTLNRLQKRPFDIALDHGASEFVMNELMRGDQHARDQEVGCIAWLWK